MLTEADGGHLWSQLRPLILFHFSVGGHNCCRLITECNWRGGLMAIPFGTPVEPDYISKILTIRRRRRVRRSCHRDHL